MDLESNKQISAQNTATACQLLPYFDSKTTTSNPKENHKKDFMSFGVKMPEGNAHFRDGLEYEERLKNIDEEETELRFLKMKHKWLL